MTTVLLVEDDAAARAFYSAALSAAGFAVKEARSGAEAMAHGVLPRPAAVVADLGLPDFDGFEVCRRLKQQPESRALPVIALTGRAMALRDIELADEAGFQAVLIKPCEPSDLVAAIERALAQPPRFPSRR